MDTTSRRIRRTSTAPVRKSVCFQAMPVSSSCMHTAFGIVTGLPSLSLTSAVEVVDVAEAVAAERERVRQQADAVLAHVEDVLDAVRRRRVAVGNEHFRQRRPVDDRAAPPLVEVSDLVQHQPFARREADPERPFLPAHGVAVDGEAPPVGLGDLDRAQVVPEPVEGRDVVRVGGQQRRGVVSRLRRQRDDALGAVGAVVGHLDDGPGVKVHDHDEALDRPGVAVLTGGGSDEGQRPDDAPLAGAVFDAGVPGRPQVDHGEGEVAHAAQPHRRLPPRVGEHDLLTGEELVEHERGLHAWDRLERDDRRGGERHDRLVGALGSPLVEHTERLAVQRGQAVAPFSGHHAGLRRLGQFDGDEAERGRQFGVLAEDGDGGRHLVGGQRLERMRRCAARHGFLLARLPAFVA